MDMQETGMWFKVLFLLTTIFVMMPCLSFGATVVNFGATLCDANQHLSSGECVPRARDKCPAGYYQTLIGATTYSAPTLELQSCMNAYDDVVLSDLFHPIYNGIVVNFGATLCDENQHLSSGECVPRERDRCPAGYYQTLIGTATYSAPTLELQSCMNAYDDTVMPDLFHPIYNGIVVNFGATLCGADEQFGAGTCQPRAQGRCDTGYYQTLIGANTFSAPLAELQQCMNSYNEFELADTLSVIYNGILVNFGATLCGDGQYLSDGTCAARTRGTCPENFYDITVSDTTMMPRENAQCATGYESFWLTANCASNDGQSNLCAILCDAGLTYTGTGTCAAMCSVNAGRNVTLNATGLSLPLYSTRVTTPALGVATSNGGVCYGNLVPGTMRGAINVTVSGKNYYISD